MTRVIHTAAPPSGKLFATVEISLWDKREQRVRPHEINIEIDPRALAETLGPKAASSKSGISKAVYGAVRVVAI